MAAGERTPGAFGPRGTSTGDESGPCLHAVSDGRQPDGSLEFPAELRGTLVADRMAGRARVVSVEGHERPGPVEPDACEVLERGGGRHELEVVVEDRYAHAR